MSSWWAWASWPRSPGVAASTLRAYLSLDEADIPAPQATVNGRSVWARPVAQEWAEDRRRSPVGIRAAVATDQDATSLPEGVEDVCRADPVVPRGLPVITSSLCSRPQAE